MIRSILKTASMMPWFIKQSWAYVVTGSVKSKVEFFIGVIPAMFRFCALTFKDCQKGYY
jgi:hypothetical protein